MDFKINIHTQQPSIHIKMQNKSCCPGHCLVPLTAATSERTVIRTRVSQSKQFYFFLNLTEMESYNLHTYFCEVHLCCLQKCTLLHVHVHTCYCTVVLCFYSCQALNIYTAIYCFHWAFFMDMWGFQFLPITNKAVWNILVYVF